MVRRAIIIVGFVCFLLAITAILVSRSAETLARHWQVELIELPDESVGTQLTKIVQLGESGVVVLAEELGSQRPAVVQATRALLVREVDRWQLLPSAESSPLVATLARELAKNVTNFQPPERLLASDLALRVLLWPLDSNKVDRGDIADHCGIILKSAEGIARSIEDPFPDPLELPAEANQSVAPLATNSGTDISVNGLLEQPAAEMPAHMVTLPALPRETVPALIDKNNSGARQLVEPALESPQELSPEMARKIPLKPLPPRSARNSGVRPLSADKPVLNRLSASQMRALSDVGVMRLLHAERATVVVSAEKELRLRDFRPVHMELARRLTDPDPAVRRELANVLPQSNIDTRPWLMWLSEDEDPEVRIVAISVIATTRDPQLLKHLRELELRESNPNVLQRLGEILKR